MELPIAEAIQSQEWTKAAALDKVKVNLQVLVRCTLHQDDLPTQLSRQALSYLVIARGVVISEEQKQSLLQAIVTHNFASRLDIGCASQQTIDALINEHLWMLEVELA